MFKNKNLIYQQKNNNKKQDHNKTRNKTASFWPES